MALSYNLGYQESISVHPTRRQYFAGKPYSNFPNIWEWLIFSKPVIFSSFFAKNSKNSPKILKIPRKFRKPMNQSRQQQQQRRKFQKFAENSENSPKIPQKEGLLWGPHIVSYRIVSRKKPSYRIDIVSNRKKAYRYWLIGDHIWQKHCLSFINT